MRWTISRTVTEQLLAASAAAHPAEACGLLLGQPGAITGQVQAPNVAADPTRRFEIEPATLLRVHREARGAGVAVVGHWHSHPDGAVQPSRRDAARAVANGQLWLVVAGDGITGWLAAPDNDPGLLHGRFAAATLATA